MAASGCDRLAYAPVLLADAPPPAETPLLPGRGAGLEPRPPELPGTTRPPPAATRLAFVEDEEEEEEEDEKEELDEEEPPTLPSEPPPGPFSSVPPMIAWAPAPGPP